MICISNLVSVNSINSILSIKSSGESSSKNIERTLNSIIWSRYSFTSGSSYLPSSCCKSRNAVSALLPFPTKNGGTMIGLSNINPMPPDSVASASLMVTGGGTIISPFAFSRCLGFGLTQFAGVGMYTEPSPKSSSSSPKSVVSPD